MTQGARLSLFFATLAACLSGACGGLEATPVEDDDAGAGPSDPVQEVGLEVPQTEPPLPPCTDGVPAPADRAPGPRFIRAWWGPDPVVAMAADSSDLFVGAGALYALAKRGGDEVRQLSPAPVDKIVVDGDALYVVTAGDPVRRMAKTGDAELALGPPAFDFAVNDAYLVTTNVLTGVVARTSKQEPRATVVLAQGTEPQGIAIRDGWAYWANYASKNVARVRLDGGQSETFEQFADYTRRIAVDCNYVYVSVGHYGGSVWRKPLAGGPAKLFVRVGGTLVLDAQSLYVEDAHGTWRVSLATGKVTSMLEGHGNPAGFLHSLVVDDQGVYWHLGGMVVRAEK